MVKQEDENMNTIEKLSIKATNWIGTPYSLAVHTLFFIGIFVLYLFGVEVDKILLILTTAVSLEAIYLAIFIQMTVNRAAKSLEEVEEDIDEIQEDVEDIQEDVEGLEEDIDEIQESDKEDGQDLENIESGLQKLLVEVENLKKKQENIRE